MTTKKRKSASTSKEAQQKAVVGSFVNIKPPEHVAMEKDDMPFFESVIAEFARSTWTNHALEIASILARTMCDMEREQRLLREEGSISYTEKGTPVANPRKTIVQMHASSILSLRKSLGMDARGKGGDARDIEKKKKQDLKHQASGDIDNLLAPPSYDA